MLLIVVSQLYCSVWIWESLPDNEFEVVDVKQGHSQACDSVRVCLFLNLLHAGLCLEHAACKILVACCRCVLLLCRMSRWWHGTRTVSCWHPPATMTASSCGVMSAMSGNASRRCQVTSLLAIKGYTQRD